LGYQSSVAKIFQTRLKGLNLAEGFSHEN
jgi:hypothetical protein